MKIAIIGAGNVGRSLASNAARAGHEVVISDRDPEEAAELAGSVHGTPTGDPKQAVAQAEIVVLAVPFASVEELARTIAGGIAGKVVVDATNPLKPTYDGLTTEGGPSGAERIQSWLPGAKVVKAFNTIFAAKQADPVVDGEPVDALIAADDQNARDKVIALAGSMGFRPVDAGVLARAKELEAMAFLIISLQVSKRGDWQSAWKLAHAPAAAVRQAAGAAAQASR